MSDVIQYWWQGRRFKHPETNHMVLFKSLPLGEQVRLNNLMKDSLETKSIQNINEHFQNIIKADKPLASFVGKMKSKNHSLYLVGGAIRDILRGKKSKDSDFVTNASPQEVSDVMDSINVKHVDVGKDFGVNVLVGDKENYEIATFRREDYGDDPHKPEKVEYLKTIEEDLERRDFTINSLAYDVFNNRVIDSHNGIEDLKKGIIRSVGNPVKRFKEDPIRIFRAFRFASTMGFEIDKDIKKVLPSFKNDPKTNRQSKERIINELDKILMSSTPEIGMGMMVGSKMNEIMMSTGKGEGHQTSFLPELTHLEGLKQNSKYHKFDALTHLLNVVKNAPASIDTKYAALFHDLGKGLKGIRTYKEDGTPQDIGHEKKSVEMADEIMKRFGFGAKRAGHIKFLISNHMKELPSQSRKHMNKFLNDLKVNFNNKADFKKSISDLFDLKIADRQAGIKLEGGDVDNIKRDKDALLNHLNETPFYSSDLNIGGNDIIKILGLKGKAVGELLKELLQRVQSGSLGNTKEELLTALEKKKQRKENV
jgi:tRNA nucleotidyltransferase/poly(A) polymerase